MKKIAIIGSGITGITSAIELSTAGLQVILLEKENYLGGNIVSFCCKATDTCNYCSVCLLVKKLKELELKKDIKIIKNVAITEIVKGTENNFTLKVLKRPPILDTDLCILCEKCYNVCPENCIEKRLQFSYLYHLYIDTLKCTKCEECVKVCPVNAINLNPEPEPAKFSVDSILFATGYKPFDARLKPFYKYKVLNDVLTAYELESMLRTNGLNLNNKKIGFIQCVGSRDVQLGNNYCSRVCCFYALKLSALLKYKFPSAEITIFYIDIQSYGKEFNSFFENCLKTIRFVRSIPSEVSKSNGRLKVRYELPNSFKFMEQDFDKIILSIGMVPQETGIEFLEKTEDGFLSETQPEGIFTAGCCNGPKTIQESIADAKNIVLKIKSKIKNWR